jgi:hypothetical protein
MVQGGAGWSRVVHGGAGGCTPMQVQGAWAGVEVRAEVQGRCAGALWLQGWCAGLGCYQSAGGPCAGAMCRDTVAAGLVCRAWGAIRVQGGSAGGCRVVQGGEWWRDELTRSSLRSLQTQIASSHAGGPSRDQGTRGQAAPT